MTAPTLSEIVNNGLCLGCGGCVSAIDRPDLKMSMQADGYLRPGEVELAASERELLGDVCPGHALDGHAQQPDYHRLWGPIRVVATGHATDPVVRYRGSSGGVITALSIGLVDSGEVEFVLTNAASEDDPINNVTGPKHDRAALLASAGSRYAPSSPLADIKRYLDAGARFAFVGKPCDVAALARWAKRDPRIDRQIPYRLAFFCAGVPSRNGTLAVLEALGVPHEQCETFQYRGEGWPGLARARRYDGTEASMDYNASWGSILNRHLQFRCKICPDGVGEFADLVCADAWYGKDGYPDFTERDGRSLIIARTERGQALYERALAAGWITSTPLDVAEIAKMQPYQVSRKRNVVARLSGLFAARNVRPRFRHLGLTKLALRTPLRQQLRNALGTFKRSRCKTLS